MCKHNDDDNVSPYLRRRLRSYDEATRDHAEKFEQIVWPDTTTGQTGRRDPSRVCPYDWENLE